MKLTDQPVDMSTGQQVTAASYWVSSSEGRMDTCISSHRDVCIVSVMLSPELQQLYSAIRLVIVYEPELAQEYHSRDNLPVYIRPSIDANKIRRVPNSSRYSELLTLPLKKPTSVLSASCLIILQMTGWRWGYHTLDILEGLTFRKSSKEGEHRYRVAMDHVFHTTSLLTVLESSLPLTYASSYDGAPVRNFQFKVHSPCTHRPRSCQVDQLPPAVILEIVRTAARMCLSESRGWPKTILSCALIKKSWKFVVQVFFELMGAECIRDEPRSLARALKAQPHMGRFLRQFKGWVKNYDYDHDIVLGCVVEERSLPPEYLSGFETILQNCPYIHIIHTGPATVEYLKTALSGLREVQEFIIDRYWEPEAKRLRNKFSILYEVIKDWKQLRHLQYWHDDEPIDGLERGALVSDLYYSDQCLPDPYAYAEDAKKPPSFSLQTLKLRNVIYAGNHILKLISSPVSSLRNLRLHKTGFIPNSILRSILTSCRDTLCDLYLYNSTIPPPPGEPFALDAELPNMVSLTTLSISPNLCTYYTLIGGPSSRHHEDHKHNHQCCVLNILQPELNYEGIVDTDDDIFWRHEEVFPGLVLAQWHNIRIWTAELDPDEFGVADSEKSRWKATGKQRGIEVEIDPWIPHHLVSSHNF